MSSFEEAKVDKVIQDSMAGEGPLTNAFSRMRKATYDDISTKNEFKRTRKTKPGEELKILSPEEIEELTNKQLEETVRTKIRSALIKAAKGESGAGMDFKEVAGFAGAVGSTASAFSSGNILGMVTAIPSLVTHSFIADYFKAAMLRWMPDKNTSEKDKPKTFDEALSKVKFARGIEELAPKFGGNDVDPEVLKAALLADLPPAKPAVAPKKPTVDPKVAKNGVAEDEDFDAPNGSTPPAPPPPPVAKPPESPAQGQKK